MLIKIVVGVVVDENQDNNWWKRPPWKNIRVKMY